jgi:hypothetical protein
MHLMRVRCSNADECPRVKKEKPWIPNRQEIAESAANIPIFSVIFRFSSMVKRPAPSQISILNSFQAL